MFNSLSGDSSGIASQFFQFAAQSNAANIDWAQLAQQWIAQNSAQSSKDITEVVTPPPPPNISGNRNNGKRSNRDFTRFESEEKGEADMEMDEMDNEEVPPAPPMLAYSSNSDANLHSTQWFASQSGNIDPMSSWNAWPNASNATSKPNPTAHIPSLMKISVPNPNESSKGDNDTNVSSNLATLDAAKRKVLPAWIREGLEKMEREKQKQLERKQQIKERDHTILDLGLNNENTVKSKFQASDHDDSSDNEQTSMDDRLNRPVSNLTRKFNDRTSTSANVENEDDDLADCDDAGETSVTVAADFGKSYEQKLADLMIAVRRTLTELLLEVTNDEIAHLAQETLNSRKLKGLAAYSSSDESDSDNSAASDNGRRRRAGSANTAGEDSEEEIKSKLRLRRRAFAKVSDEIEERIAANAAREEQKLKFYKQKEQQYLDNDESEESDGGSVGQTQQHRSLKNSSTPENAGMGKNYARDFGETTTDSKLQSSNGKRTRERGRRGERTTRFSDNKDTKSISAVTATYITQLAAVSNTTAIPPTTIPAAIPQYPINAGSTHTVTDTMTKLQNFYPPTSATAVGINTVMNAADAALEKAAKSKSSSSKMSTTSTRRRYDDDYDDGDDDDARTGRRGDRDRERDRHHRRRQGRRHDSRRHTSDESDSTINSKDSSNDSSNSSHSSRHSKYSRASTNSYSRHKHSSGSSSRRDDYKRYHSGHDRHDDRYPRHSSSSKSSKYTTDRATSSSSKHTRRDRSRSRDRDRSRSRSTYSSSSSKRHRH